MFSMPPCHLSRYLSRTLSIFRCFFVTFFSVSSNQLTYRLFDTVVRLSAARHCINVIQWIRAETISKLIGLISIPICFVHGRFAPQIKHLFLTFFFPNIIFLVNFIRVCERSFETPLCARTTITFNSIYPAWLWCCRKLLQMADKSQCIAFDLLSVLVQYSVISSRHIESLAHRKSHPIFSFCFPASNNNASFCWAHYPHKVYSYSMQTRIFLLHISLFYFSCMFRLKQVSVGFFSPSLLIFAPLTMLNELQRPFVHTFYR